MPGLYLRRDHGRTLPNPYLLTIHDHLYIVTSADETATITNMIPVIQPLTSVRKIFDTLYTLSGGPALGFRSKYLL